MPELKEDIQCPLCSEVMKSHVRRAQTLARGKAKYYYCSGCGAEVRLVLLHGNYVERRN